MHDVEQKSSVQVLRNRNFLSLWLGQALSQTAQNAVFYALLVYVEVTTGSTFHMSVLILTSILPSVFFGVAAGVFVDRVKKKTVLVVTNVLRGTVIVVFLVVSLDVTPVHIHADTGEASILAFAVIYVLNFIFSTISQFFGPAEAASIPLLVPRKQLITANGLFNLTFTTSQLAGFVLIAPPLIKWFGVTVLFVIIIIIYDICAVLMTTIPLEEPEHRPLSGLKGSTLLASLKAELQDGWALLTGDKLISLAMLQLTLAATLMLVLGMLAPGFVARVLGVRADDAVYIFAPAGLGILLGTIVLPRLTERFGKPALSSIGLIAMSLSLAVLSIAQGGGGFLMSTVVPRLIDPGDI
ncbi:MAG: MFS transporter, partial [Dehalococcoidia bacterium]|nr:MFS transporter [Dehalococcoidia bacterium]